MKKLLSILLAISMVFSTAIIVLAEDNDIIDYDEVWNPTTPEPGDAPDPIFDLYTGESSTQYLAGEEINLVIKVRNINLPEQITVNGLPQPDGLSLVAFDLTYDKDKVAPIVEAVADADNDLFSFASLLKGTVQGWEAVGKLDEDNGVYELAFSDTENFSANVKIAKNHVVDDDVITIEIPFTVKEGVSGDDIVFGFSDVVCCNRNWTKVCYPGTSSDINVEDSGAQIQPLPAVEVPTDAIGITYAGYRHEGSAVVILSSAEETTLGALALKGDAAGIGAEPADMNYWVVLIADADGKVTYTNFSLTRDVPAAIKTDVVVPANSYVIAAHGENAAARAAIEASKIGSTVTLYNVNPVGVTFLKGFQSLTNAGFKIFTPRELQPAEKTPLPAGAFTFTHAGHIHSATATVIMAVDGESTILEMAKRAGADDLTGDFNYWGIAICNAEGEITYVDTAIGRPDHVKGSVVVPAGSFLVAINGNQSAVLAKFKAAAVVGKVVTLYNVFADGVKDVTTAVALTEAGFTIGDKPIDKPVLVDDAPANFDEEKDTVTLFAEEKTIEDFKKLFKDDVKIFKADGTELASGLVGTGMRVGKADGPVVIVLGDTNGDGKIDTIDYSICKRIVLNNFPGATDLQKAASDVDGSGGDINTVDYSMLKRHVLDTFDIYSRFLAD